MNQREGVGGSVGRYGGGLLVVLLALYPGGHWFLLNSKVHKDQLPISIGNKKISNIILNHSVL